MSNTKQKLLDILSDRLEDVSEAGLSDMLLDLYNQKVAEVERLREANAEELVGYQRDRELIREEMRKMRSDPLYCAAGEYQFQLGSGKLIRIFVQGSMMRVMEELPGADMWAVAQQVPRA